MLLAQAASKQLKLKRKQQGCLRKLRKKCKREQRSHVQIDFAAFLVASHSEAQVSQVLHT